MLCNIYMYTFKLKLKLNVYISFNIEKCYVGCFLLVLTSEYHKQMSNLTKLKASSIKRYKLYYNI